MSIGIYSNRPIYSILKSHGLVIARKSHESGSVIDFLETHREDDLATRITKYPTRFNFMDVTFSTRMSSHSYASESFEIDNDIFVIRLQPSAKPDEVARVSVQMGSVFTSTPFETVTDTDKALKQAVKVFKLIKSEFKTNGKFRIQSLIESRTLRFFDDGNLSKTLNHVEKMLTADHRLLDLHKLCNSSITEHMSIPVDQYNAFKSAIESILEDANEKIASLRQRYGAVETEEE